LAKIQLQAHNSLFAAGQYVVNVRKPALLLPGKYYLHTDKPAWRGQGYGQMGGEWFEKPDRLFHMPPMHYNLVQRRTCHCHRKTSL
jgi:hypothetical protein